MLKSICFYNNKIFVTLDCFLIAYSYRKFPNLKNEQFSEYFKIKLPVKCTSTSNTEFHVVDNYATGLKSLVIFLSDTSGHWNIFIYSDAFRKKLYQINVPTFTLGVKDCLFVSDGPTLLFYSKNAFHMYPLSHCGNKYPDFSFPFSDYKEFKVLQFKCIGPSESSCQLFLYLLIISCNFSSQHSLIFLGLISNISNPVTSFEQFTINAFFPQSYETVLKTVEIIKATPHLKTDLSIENIEWKETATVICTENEFLFFSNGDLHYCCKLTIPLTNVICMRTNFMNTFSGNVNLVLTFEDKSVFFIEIKQDMNLEVVKQWTDIEATVIGDILMKGSKQVLLLKQTDLNLWQNNIILYDLSSFMPIDILCDSSVPDNCLMATISGLERKVQVGKSAIRDIEVEISQKSAATIDALIKLNEYKVTAENQKLSYTFQQSLVDLILSKDENKTETDVTESESYVKLLEEKHRFMDDKWIISLCFINDSEKHICYPSVKVLKKDSQLVCIQKLFVCSSDDPFFGSEYGREINSKSKFYIVVALENLVFQTEDNIFMILSWYNGSTGEFNNEVFTKEDKKVLIQNQLCMQTRITLSDIFKQPIQKGISSPCDLLFNRSLQQVTNICVSSLHSDISKLEDILIKSDSTSNGLHMLEENSTKCVIFNSDNSSLFGTHFIIMKSAPNVVEIRAFNRNGSEACLLVHYLYEHLPKDIMIFPCLKFKDESTEVKKNLTLSMKNEVDLLMSSFNAHNISEEMRKSYMKLMSSQTVGTLTIPKVNYHRIREVLVKKECITDTLLKSLSADSYFI